MVRKIDYQFTPFPTQLGMCCDCKCRNVLFSLIQLSTYYESKNKASFDGWFYRSNALLQEEADVSQNALNGALDALYQAGIIDIIPQQKGKGKAQGARKYKVIFDSFVKYESIPFEDCSCKHPDFGIVTPPDYKHRTPSFQLKPQLEEQPKSGKSDNNIDIINNTENTDNIEKENTYYIDNNIINNNLDISYHLEQVSTGQEERETGEGEPVPSNDRGDDALEGFDFNSSRGIEMESSEGLQASEENDNSTQSPSITPEFIDSQIPFVYSRVQRMGPTQEPDNYTDAANDILDEYSGEVKSWISCVKSKSMYSGMAMTRLVEVINGRDYESQDECEETALNLIDYSAKAEAQYLTGLRDRVYN